MLNTTGKMTTHLTPSQNGRKIFELETKEFYLGEIKWFYAFMKRNPEHAEKVVEIIFNYKKLYETK